jgi:hypothetical protein
MKKLKHSDTITSMIEFCRRNQIPISCEEVDAFLIEDYDGPTQSVSVFIVYDLSKYHLIVNPKGSEVIDDSVLTDVLRYHNAANSSRADTTLFACPDCGRAEMYATLHIHDRKLNDGEIRQMLDQVLSRFEQHASVVQNIIAGKVSVEDAIQKAMERRALR